MTTVDQSAALNWNEIRNRASRGEGISEDEALAICRLTTPEELKPLEHPSTRAPTQAYSSSRTPFSLPLSHLHALVRPFLSFPFHIKQW